MRFNPDQFTDTRFDTAEAKADFANHFVKFVEDGHQWEDFPDWFYRRLSMTFGHIAHYDRVGFYNTFFTSAEGLVRFARHTHGGQFWIGRGDPSHTWADVEQVLMDWAERVGYLVAMTRNLNEQTKDRELAEYVRLQEKYG